MPITSSGVTKPLYQQAQQVAAAVAAQKAPATPTDHSPKQPSVGPVSNQPGPPNSGTTGDAPATSTPGTGPSSSPGNSKPVADAALVPTAAVSSRTGGGLLLLLVGIGVVAGVGALASQTALRGKGLR